MKQESSKNRTFPLTKVIFFKVQLLLIAGAGLLLSLWNVSKNLAVVSAGVPPNEFDKIQIQIRHSDEAAVEEALRTQSSKERRPLKSVAVIGAGGFIGSRLVQYLKSTEHQVVGYDRYLRAKTVSSDIILKSSQDLSSEELKRFDAVVFLGGLTGRKACDKASGQEVREENIHEPENIAKKMGSDQIFIFASTSAITEGSGDTVASEDHAVKEELLDSYSTSMFAREKALRQLSQVGINVTKIVGLRFGTVVGHSRGQRVDMIHMALIRSAHTVGYLTLKHLETNRAFLALKDLVRAIGTIINNPNKVEPFDIFHLVSFNSDVSAVGNEIAMHTGARIKAYDATPDVTGFSMTAKKFRERFQFDFEENKTSVVVDMMAHTPESLTPKGVHEVPPLNVGNSYDHDSMPCPVCGSHDLQTTLDLSEQPLANDFRPTAIDSLSCPRHKLKLVRCRSCNHLFLSTVVNRSALFSKYLYKSGTSRTLQKYFEWLAKKVADNVSRPSRKSSGKVLEIASNDGSQLDQFKKLGWETYGVDPAANIVPESVKKGHRAEVGFWGVQEFNHLPPPSELDAIVAQNVFAHVPKPVDFLTACRKVMGEHTKLYIQTSQCNMHQKGQFDTAYHEHISFFTAHSFKRAAELSGLHMAAFELVK